MGASLLYTKENIFGSPTKLAVRCNLNRAKSFHYKPVIAFLAGTHYGQDSVRGRKEEWHRLLVSSLEEEEVAEKDED